PAWPSPWRPSMCSSSGMASNPTRRVSCLSRSLSLVCKIPMSLLGLSETNTIGYYDGLVEQMLGCGNPDTMGSIDYRCLRCGEGTHRVAMSCKSSLCLRCAKVYVDTWVSQVSQMLHEGVIYRHIVLTMPALLRTTFYQNAKVLLSAFMRCGVTCL